MGQLLPILARRSVPGRVWLGASGEGLHGSAAAHRDAGLDERAQEVEEEVVEDLLVKGLLAGQAEGGGEFLRDGEADGVAVGFAATVATVGERHRSLHDAAVAPIDI